MTDPNRLFDAALDRYGAPRVEDAARGEVALAVGRSAARGRRRRRQASRALALLFVALVGLRLLPESAPSESSALPGAALPGGGRVTEPVAAVPSWRLVADQRGIATRLSVREVSGVRRLRSTEPRAVQRIAPRTTQLLDDDGLGEWLRRSGRPPGRIRMGDEVLVPGAADLAQITE